MGNLSFYSKEDFMVWGFGHKELGLSGADLALLWENAGIHGMLIDTSIPEIQTIYKNLVRSIQYATVRP